MESAVAAGSFPFAVPDNHCLHWISEGADFRSPAVYLSVENRNEFGYNLPVPGGFSPAPAVLHRPLIGIIPADRDRKSYRNPGFPTDAYRFYIRFRPFFHKTFLLHHSP